MSGRKSPARVLHENKSPPTGYVPVRTVPVRRWRVDPSAHSVPHDCNCTRGVYVANQKSCLLRILRNANLGNYSVKHAPDDTTHRRSTLASACISTYCTVPNKSHTSHGPLQLLVLSSSISPYLFLDCFSPSCIMLQPL